MTFISLSGVIAGAVDKTRRTDSRCMCRPTAVRSLSRHLLLLLLMLMLLPLLTRLR